MGLVRAEEAKLADLSQEDKEIIQNLELLQELEMLENMDLLEDYEAVKNMETQESGGKNDEEDN